ncbi:MAG: hypothetical protein A2X77_02465 [Gammaproteobacteria bacterium GWE2_42_36]|nr:MAG: hypothetical protein A2X77_02465 [Gammaproteobacteria bacterium GWE2_42_36]
MQNKYSRGKFNMNSKKINDIFPYCMICLVIAGYMLLSFNKYVPAQEGWFDYDCLLMKAGKFPYKDFYLHIPPLFLLLIHTLHKLFGEDLIVLRLYGVVERVVISCLIFYILKKNFKPNAAFIATLLGIFFYSSFNVDLPYSYYQTAFLISLLTACIFENALNKINKVSHGYIAAGIFIAILFFLKQSTSMVMLITLLLIMIGHYLRLAQYRRLLITIAYFGLGFAIITSIIIIWLISHHAFAPYLKIVFLTSESKGSPSEILFGFIPRLFNGVKSFPLIMIVSTLFAYHLFAKRFQETKTVEDKPVYILYGILIIIAYGYTYWDKSIITKFMLLDNINALTQKIIILCVFYLLLSLITYTYRWYKNPQNMVLRSKLFWIVFAAMWAYSHAMSGVLEISAFMFGLPLCLLLFWSNYKNKYFMYPVKFATITIGIAAIILISSQKYATPYYWWGWGEPDVRTATETTTIPRLKGMRISLRDKLLFEHVFSLISKNSSPSDDVFFFPHISLFNILSDRTYSAYTTVCYFDVCSDTYAEQTAEYLVHKKPKLILDMLFPESAWKIHEEIFRQGKPSGQRKIQQVITQMTHDGTYQQIAMLSTEGNYPIVILKRTDFPMRKPHG